MIYLENLIFRSELRGLELRSRRITSSARLTKNVKWAQKRELGYYTRHMLIAYTLLRGIDYKKIERNCKTKPDVDLIHAIIVAHVGPWKGTKWPREKIKALLGFEVLS